jgi:hypothetical protein
MKPIKFNQINSEMILMAYSRYYFVLVRPKNVKNYYGKAEISGEGLFHCIRNEEWNITTRSAYKIGTLAESDMNNVEWFELTEDEIERQIILETI